MNKYIHSLAEKFPFFQFFWPWSILVELIKFYKIAQWVKHQNNLLFKKKKKKKKGIIKNLIFLKSFVTLEF